MATTSGSFSLNDREQASSWWYHTNPTIALTVTWNCSRDSERSLSTHWWGSVDISGRSYGSFGYTMSVQIVVNGVQIANSVAYGPGLVSHSFNFDGYVNIDSSSVTMNVNGTCTAGSGCYWGNDGHRWDSRTLSVPNYNPYSPPSIWLNPNAVTTLVGKVGITNYKVYYSLHKGTNNLQWTRAQLFNYNTKAFIKYYQYNRTTSSNAYTDTYLLNETQFQHGSRYRLAMSTYDGVNEIWTPDRPSGGGNGVTIYTYQKPTIGTTLSIDNPLQNASQGNTFNIYNYNNRAWSNYESEFQTRYRVQPGNDTYSDWVNVGNLGSINLTDEQIRTYIPNTYDGIQSTVQFKRYSPSSDWWSDDIAEGNLTVYYRPRIPIVSNDVTYKRNDGNGTIINKNTVVTNDSTLSNIYVSWNYDTSQALAGYVQGYRIQILDENDNIVQTYYTSNKYYSIPKNDIPRLQFTKLTITPYYTAGEQDPDNYWYYNLDTIEKINFIKLVSELNTPVITYPVQGSNWINTDFRVCFELPIDDDYSAVAGTYTYENIELMINDTYVLKIKTGTNGETTTGTTGVYEQAFSTAANDMTYRKKIIIYPKLWSNFPISTTYKLKVRVKKQYGTDSTNFRWSKWSDERVFIVTPTSYNVSSGDIIRASHYNTTRDTVNRVRYTYGVEWNNIPESVVANSTIIRQVQYPYNNLYKIIVDTKLAVNTYGPIMEGRENIKFDANDEILDTFTPTLEKVTALSQENNSPNGRNYMGIIYDRCNKLK